ncbi:MAG TPA: TetR/AcrR family transcriptional regulator [Iamia sp.]
MPRISPSDLARRRQRIVDAAAACLDRDGPDGVTTRAVASEAGISIGALYHHFPSLDALWDELTEQRLLAGIGAVAARARPGEDPLTWAVRALVCAPPLGVPDRPAGRVARATLDEVLRAARAADTLRPGVDDEALAELLELVWEAVDRRPAVGLRTSGDRLAAALGDLVERGVRPVTSG